MLVRILVSRGGSVVSRLHVIYLEQIVDSIIDEQRVHATLQALYESLLCSINISKAVMLDIVGGDGGRWSFILVDGGCC